MVKKIVLAFSGGVDSTIAAIRLTEAGYKVEAVYLDLWKWQDEHQQIIKVEKNANELKKIIPLNFHSIDAGGIMKKIVVDDFKSQLASGMTPSPCVRCNPMVKFALMLKFADEHAIDSIATGHYARIRQKADGSYALLKARDASKDQSYMLCYLNQEILSRTVFPLGDTLKSENKLLAERYGLSVSEQAESQDLCFLNHYSYNDFVEHFSADVLKPGDIVDVKGNLLGKHNGLALYTIGQRKGVKIPSEEAYYVIDKDILQNRLIVGYLSELGKQAMIVENANWIDGKEIIECECDVKIRYRSKLHNGLVSKLNDKKGYHVQFNEKLRDITPGQYAVFYNDEEVLGGGMIVRAL